MAPPAPRLRKDLGQHHLIRGESCRPLVEFLAPQGRRVLEIGPGGGVLTEALLGAGAARVDAWELDPAWAFELRRRLWRDQAAGRLGLVLGDALDLEPGRLRGPVLLAGNLPYNVATAILERLLAGIDARRVPRLGFLVQWEVGERLWAAPGGRDYGALTVLVAARARVIRLGRVPKGAFRPPPRVDGAFVGFEPRTPPVEDPRGAGLAPTVRLAFRHRRKTLRRSLAAGWGREVAEAALAGARIDGGRRPEQLSLDEFVALANACRC